MKKAVPRMQKDRKERIKKYADGIMSVAILIFTFKAVSLVYSEYSSATDYFIVYLLFAATCILRSVSAFRKDNLSFVKYICFAVVYAASGTAVLLLDVCTAGVLILMESFLAIVLANRILAAITVEEWTYKLINIVFVIVVVFFIVSSLSYEQINTKKFLLAHAIFVSAKALGNIILISFSHIRLLVLRKIIRKTFAIEILFGMILLIGSFSYVFQVLEKDIETYYDAVWYCFAVVTTIGFGDVTVTSPYSRALSIILGIYGIIVVALVTSVIVNFYNEVKDEKDDEENDDAPSEELSTEPATQKEALQQNKEN